MNLITPFAGGIPLCHGAGGLAGQYFFGARTAGTNLIEGGLEVLAGLLLAGSAAALIAAFPEAILGAMLLMVGAGMALGSAREARRSLDLLLLAITVAGALAVNMLAGFALGLSAHYLIGRLHRHRPAGTPSN
jgi:MFS superfamily sulfate permease-like transporter